VDNQKEFVRPARDGGTAPAQPSGVNASIAVLLLIDQDPPARRRRPLKALQDGHTRVRRRRQGRLLGARARREDAAPCPRLAVGPSSRTLRGTQTMTSLVRLAGVEREQRLASNGSDAEQSYRCPSCTMSRPRSSPWWSDSTCGRSQGRPPPPVVTNATAPLTVPTPDAVPVNYRVRSVSFTVVRAPGQTLKRPQLSSPATVVPVVRARIPDDAREHFGALYFDTQNRLVAAHEVSSGTLSTSLVAPREISGPALRLLLVRPCHVSFSFCGPQAAWFGLCCRNGAGR
jgi:RadC-like JAB domain